MPPVGQHIQRALRHAGVDVARYRSAGARRAALLTEHQVATVVDVGANVGQFAMELRAEGFAGHIASFEPLSATYEQLLEASAADERWEAHRLALSDSAGAVDINIAANTASSSLLTMKTLHAEIAPDATIVGTEQVQTARLDELAETWPRPLMLKADTQGHELAVLRGAEGLLDDVVLLEMEVSVRELYDGQPLLHDVLNEVAYHGFRLVLLEPGFHDPRDGTIMQFDAVFARD